MPVLLVIDDEAGIQHAFRRVFREPDVRLLTASTAREGLELAARHRPDTVIFDIQLPDRSGLEAYKQLRQIDPRVPVLFITGHGTTDQAIEAMKLGAFDFLLKPVRLDQLRGVVARAFEVSRLMRTPAVVAGAVPEEGPSDVLGRLFEPFVSTKPTGTGLGLSVSRRIIEEHDGTIRVQNRPEGGACFTIRLPARPVETHYHADAAHR